MVIFYTRYPIIARRALGRVRRALIYVVYHLFSAFGGRARIVVCNVYQVALVYKIPYRRAPRLAYQPLGRVRRASKGILHTRVARAKVSCIQVNWITINILYKIPYRRVRAWPSARAKVSHAYKLYGVKSFRKLKCK